MLIIDQKDILILGKVPAQGLDDTTFTAEKEYAINCSEKRNICKYWSKYLLIC